MGDDLNSRMHLDVRHHINVYKSYLLVQVLLSSAIHFDNAIAAGVNVSFMQ